MYKNPLGTDHQVFIALQAAVDSYNQIFISRL